MAQKILHLPNGVLSHDTFGRVPAMLNPDAFECGLLQWVKGWIEATGKRALHIDGKTLRGSYAADNISDLPCGHESAQTGENV